MNYKFLPILFLLMLFAACDKGDESIEGDPNDPNNPNNPIDVEPGNYYLLPGECIAVEVDRNGIVTELLWYENEKMYVEVSFGSGNRHYIDENGLIEKIELYIVDDEIFSTSTYTYNSDGFLVQEVFVWDGGQITSDFSYNGNSPCSLNLLTFLDENCSHEYTTSGGTYKKVLFDSKKDPTGKIWPYNGDGGNLHNMIEDINVNSSGDSTHIKRTNMEYNEFDYLTKYNEVKEQFSDGVLTSTKTYTVNHTLFCIQ